MTDCDACGDIIPEADGKGGIPVRAERDGEEFSFCRDCDGYKTLRVPTADWVLAQRQRKEAGREWGEQIVRPDETGMDTPTTIDLDALEEFLLAANDRDTTLTVGELVDELERTRELVESVPERTADELEGRFR